MNKRENCCHDRYNVVYKPSEDYTYVVRDSCRGGDPDVPFYSERVAQECADAKNGHLDVCDLSDLCIC